MVIPLPLEEMSVEDKLRTMELLWNDLCREPEALPSPEWHEKVLSEREKLVHEGKSCFSSWNEVKQSLRERAK